MFYEEADHLTFREWGDRSIIMQNNNADYFFLDIK